MKGWDELQKEKLRRIDSIGLVDLGNMEYLQEEASPSWSSVPDGDFYPGYHATSSVSQDKDDWDLKMAVYAAQIDCMDQNIGRIIRKLKDIGQYENTIIMFLQDNGACAEGVGKDDTNAPGTPESYMAYGLPWAHLSNTPFRMYKHFLHEGGISTPFIFHWPAGMPEERKGQIEMESFGHLIDVVPTCLDAAGVLKTGNYNLLEGQSLLGVIRGDMENAGRTICWEHEGSWAIRKGDWKLVSRYEDDYLYFNSWGFPKSKRGSEWELYNIRKDRRELNDLAGENPELVNSLMKDYIVWSEKVGVLPRKELIKGSNFDF